MLVGLSLSNYSDIFLARFVRLINMFRLFFLWWFCLFNQIYEFLSSYIYFSSWAGVPKLHSCTWCFSRTFRFNVVGIHETHYITFHCWWCFSSLWEDILSVIFHHTGGVICITKFKQASMKLKFYPWTDFFSFFFFLLQKVRNIKLLPVDLKAINDGLSSLLLPSQKAMFSQHMYASIIVVWFL